jgi:hypothetical protein
MRMLFTNENEGTQSRVVALQSKPGWYAVTLMDLDSGEVLPCARKIGLTWRCQNENVVQLESYDSG